MLSVLNICNTVHDVNNCPLHQNRSYSQAHFEEGNAREPYVQQ
jgi:hypothetical protein